MTEPHVDQAVAALAGKVPRLRASAASQPRDAARKREIADGLDQLASVVAHGPSDVRRLLDLPNLQQAEKQQGDLMNRLVKNLTLLLTLLCGSLSTMAQAGELDRVKKAVKKAVSDVNDAVTTAAEQAADAAEKAVNQAGDVVETVINQTDAAVDVATDQIDAEAERAAESIKRAGQTAERQLKTNHESLNQWVAKQEASLCRLMSGGADEQCMEQGIEGSVDNKGEVTVSNPTTGERFPVTSSEGEDQQKEATADAAETAEILLSFRIMQPKDNLAMSPLWRQASRSVGAEGIYAWGLALDNLPADAADSPELQALWRQVESAYQAANNARNSGDARPIVLVAGVASSDLTAGEVAKRVYDGYGQAKEVWDVMMGAYKFSFIGVVSDVVAPETISPTSDRVVQVPGLYPEEKAAIEAVKAYYNALPHDVRWQYEIKSSPPAEQSQIKNLRCPLL